MKTVSLLILLLSSSVYATSLVPDLNTEDCVTTCHSTGQHTYQRHGRYEICHEIMSCDVLEWNDNVGSCELVREENRKVPTLCRDIPPAY